MRSNLCPVPTARKLLIVAPQIRSMVTRYLRENLKDLQINIQEFDLLRFSDGQDVRMIDLAERMSVTPSAVTKIADSLFAKGFIARRADPNDRRVVRLRLTGAGARALGDVMNAASDYLSPMIEGLSDDDGGRLDTGLSALVAAIEERNAGPNRPDALT